MNKYHLTLLSVVFLFLQPIYCRPPLNYALAENNGLQLENREDLLTFLLMGIYVGSAEFVDASTPLLENVLEELKMENNKTDEFLKYINKFENQLEILKELNTSILSDNAFIREYILVNAQLFELFDSFNTTYIEHPSNELIKTEQLLLKNGLMAMKERFLKHYMEFENPFKDIIQTYIVKLDPTQKIQETKLILWFKQYKTENDIEKRPEYLQNFTSFFKEQFFDMNRKM